MSKIPVTIISGFLGTGKSTTLKYLLSQKPPGERWAVLVNEYGEIGIDGVILRDLDNNDDVLIKELPNGCICCTSGFMFKFAILFLIRKRKPDRLLVEPTGLAALNSIIDTFREPGLERATELRSVITLVDPAQWCDPKFREHPTYRDQIEGSDVLLATRGDLTTSEIQDQFYQEATALYPPKSHVGRCDHGQIKPRLLDMVSPRMDVSKTTTACSNRKHSHDHSHEEINLEDIEPAEGLAGKERRSTHHDDDVHAGGWTFPPTYQFSAERLAHWLKGDFLPDGFIRLKGVFCTDEGWAIINATTAEQTISETAYRRDSRVEILAPPTEKPDWEQAEAELRACIITTKFMPSGASAQITESMR